MNVLLWVAQIALALLCLSGGAYKTFAFDAVAPTLPALSRGGWSAVGVFEMIAGLLLIVPAALKQMPTLTPLAATALTLETLALAAIYASYSRALTPSNPLLWAVVMAVLAGFVAYGRYRLAPIA